CRAKVNSRLTGSIPKGVTVLDRENPTLLPKALKNLTEVENERIAHIKDGVALTKFIYWLKTNVGKIPMTEISAADKLNSLRAEQENFMGNSFDPIISYGPHAAINHYSAAPETDIPIEAKGLLLADTGGHYLEGTTDVTRTVVMGPTTDEQKKYFTAVLRGTLNLAAAKFRYGVSGLSLDYLARGPLWELGKDFNHGTGHGVGYFLNVHEGPNSFHWRSTPSRKADTVFEEGMITSDEPGYYVEGEYGIRHENLIVCVKDQDTEVGPFLRFEHLTMAPFDLDAIVPEQMTARERELLNSYHSEVYQKISPYLNDDEKEWLKNATREI
ncbi:MAG: M24 family metallopeptidase, partial [Lachnospiraceae bacterium]|nr:M24 family metallopeptidase [Lachnospiraceae bacterium]